MSLEQLLEAARSGSAAGLRGLLAAASAQQRSELLRAGDTNGATPLQYASWRGHEDCVALLLEECTAAGGAEERRAALLAANRWGDTALHNAAGRGHEGCAALLLAQAGGRAERREMLAATNRLGQTASEQDSLTRSGRTVESKERILRLLREAAEEGQPVHEAKAAPRVESGGGKARWVKMRAAGGAGSGDAERPVPQREPRAKAKAAVEYAVKGGSIALLHAAMAEVESTGTSTSHCQALAPVLRRIAEVALQAAAREGSLSALSAAVAEADSVGVEDSALETARRLLQLLRHAAEGALSAATREESLPALQTAVAQAKAAEVGHSQVEAAQSLLAKLQRKGKAREELKVAMQDGGLDALRRAAAEAEAAGVEASELAVARRLIALLQSSPRTTWQARTEQESIQSLHTAITQAEAAGVVAPELRVAQDLVLELQGRGDPHGSERNVSLESARHAARGLAAALQRMARAAWEAGLEERAALLQAAIDEASESGFEAFELSGAQSLMAGLRRTAAEAAARAAAKDAFMHAEIPRVEAT